ncbi:MAG: hypothetical protein K6G78_03135 [bacterium]|nr:hypothetical protein [bacterium]
MKKLLAILASALLCVAFLVGCGGGSDDSGDDNQAPVEWAEMSALGDLTLEDILRIDFEVDMGDGSSNGFIPSSDMEAVQKVCGMLEEISIGKAADELAEGLPLNVTITTTDGELEFKFIGDTVELSDGQRYKVENIEPLRDYLAGLVFGD